MFRSSLPPPHHHFLYIPVVHSPRQTHHPSSDSSIIQSSPHITLLLPTLSTSIQSFFFFHISVFGSYTITMFSWFSRSSSDIKVDSDLATSAPQQHTSTAAPIPSKARSNSANVLSPPRDIPKRRSSPTTSAGLCGSIYDNWADVPVPATMARTSSFSSTDSRSSNASTFSAADQSVDPSFSYAARYGKPRTTSAFLSDEELLFSGSDDPSYLASRMSFAYNNNASRNTLYQPQRRSRPAPPARQPRANRSSTRSRMNAINEE